MSSFTFQIITNDILPQSYINKIVPSSSSSTEDKIIIRSNISTFDEISKWITEFGHKSETQWNVRSSNPHGINIICS